ncbi:putative bifunctional diguanylate cyclase/phosphodiesterase [Pseudomonas aeruginosa]|uniref:putative bifunctional diguanylate cyclase/phosphodiesterase n=1 Tax=Pseudomonas aeruginosa TaxID=287 RepID=UPI00149594AA|nr:EAL domain-containing protein [Pseudomonas aeruginosa]NPT08566.1 EAL domain-containing protein [Pseudomonas aeruginosa]HCF7230603.1 EAL domain-containing protein [Pseudomonas aeruginosa]
MSPRLSALRLSLAYLAIAIAWAFLSDHLLQNQVQDHDQLVFWMTAKRLFFFAATGLLLYLYLVRQFRRKAQAYDELHGSEQRLNRALEAVRDGLWDWDLVTDRMFVSPGYAALIGLAPEELGDPIETWKKRLHPEEYAAVLEAHRNHLQGLTDNLDHIYRLRHKDGDYRWIHSRGRVLRDALGKPLHYTGVARDITLQRLKEDHLRQAAAVFDSTREGVLVTDAQAVIVHVNPSFERITGYRSEDVLGKTPAILRSGRQDQAFYQRLWLALREQDVWSGEIWNRRKSGEIYPQWLHIRAVRNDQGQLTHYVGVFSDLSSIKRSENELDFLAHHDSLTGLPNRVLLRERIEQALENGKDRTVAGALLLIDLDHFKHINDSLGHTTGDMLLKEVSKRLQHQLDERCLLSRLGGDEFAILVENDDPEAVARLSQRILDGFNAPFDIHCQPIYISASLGVSLYPEDASDVDHLMQHADAALFQAKDSGRNAYAFYTRVLTARARAHVQVESALRHALDHDELRVHYQPVHDLASGRIVGVESLVRWQHPERGLVPPGEFVPVAEECGLIAALDNWVLKRACRQMREWQQRGVELEFVAVNVSSRLFNRGGLEERIANALEESGLEPRYLELEVTESAVMEDFEQSLNLLCRLRILGVNLAIDDFGTGYSSLMRLKRLPVHKLKIDQGFVAGLPGAVDDAAIARAIVALAQSMGLRVVAEGIEHQDQALFLREHGCDFGQGYWYGRPQPAEALRFDLPPVALPED